MADIGFNRQTTNYYEDWLDGDGVPGSSFTLSYSPIDLDDVVILTQEEGKRPTRRRIAYDEDAAGTTKCTLSGSGNKTLTMGSNIVVATDQTVIVRYWAYGVGYNASLEAVEVAEKYDRQGDSESITVKEKVLMVETDTDSAFTTNVSMQGMATLALMVDKENIANMPYNKFKIMEIKASFAQSSPDGWVDWRLWFAKQDDFYNSKGDPDIDDMWFYIDIASTMICSLGSTVEEEAEVTNYFFWPPRNQLLSDGLGAFPSGSFVESGAPIYYEDEDGTNELHLMLENRSPDIAHEAGADKIKFWFKIIPIR